MTKTQSAIFGFACGFAGLFFVINLACVTGALATHPGRPHWVAAYILLTLSWVAMFVAILASHLIVRRR